MNTESRYELLDGQKFDYKTFSGVEKVDPAYSAKEAYSEETKVWSRRRQVKIDWI